MYKQQLIPEPQQTYTGDVDLAGGFDEKSNFGRGPFGFFSTIIKQDFT